MPQFIFTVCQAGAEDALKKEIAREHPELKFAYSRPGFVTFKHAEGGLAPTFELRSVFARAFGLSVGKAKTAEEVLKIAETAANGSALKFHVFERERYEPEAEPKGYLHGLVAKALRAKLEKWPLFTAGAPKLGELVFDVVIVEENEFWLGVHTHNSTHSSFAGGIPELKLPELAPSRAYLKFEEAVRWTALPLQKGQTIVEIGSAPGGACFAMLERGLKVTGIDAAEMAPSVLKHPSKNFVHLKKSIESVEPVELPPTIHWLAVDMNTKPEIALSGAEKIITYAEGLLGCLITIKLNDWMTADFIPEYIARIRRMGMARVKATQLVSNKREICVVGLTRLGLDLAQER